MCAIQHLALSWDAIGKCYEKNPKQNTTRVHTQIDMIAAHGNRHMNRCTLEPFNFSAISASESGSCPI